MYTRVKTTAELAAMRESGRMLATVLEVLVATADVGMSTKELSLLAAKELKALGGKPAFLGYEGFSDVLCTSVNDAVVHGIPSEHMVLKSGDIIGLDFGVTYRGMITDAARSVIVGTPLPGDEKLLQTTLESLDAGIFAVQDGCKTQDIGAAVQAVLERGGYGIVRDLVGHGVGHHVHEEPNIPNYGKKGKGERLEAGMTIAIEPMATRGDWRVRLHKDGWTILTADGSRSAHFEDTVLITEEGAEILTRL
jgi:methionyl aminopeptidase